MEAKDTVMDSEDLQRHFATINDLFPMNTEDRINTLYERIEANKRLAAEAQAEVSFKLGYEQGYNDCIGQLGYTRQPEPQQSPMYLDRDGQWQTRSELSQDYDPQAERFSWFIEHGWTPPEEAKDKVEGNRELSLSPEVGGKHV